MSIQNIQHAKALSWNREFYCIQEDQETGALSVTVRTLNIFQRILRFLFGLYSNSILNQKKINQLWVNHRPQRAQISALVTKVDELGKKLILPQSNNNRNVLIVGRSRGGKSTMLKMLKDPFHIAPSSFSIFASTRLPEVTELELSDHTFRVLDTPGLSEYWSTESETRKRSDEELALLIRDKAQEIFGGIGFGNIDTVIMTFSAVSGLNRQDVDAMNRFLPMMVPGTQKLMAVTRSEGSSDKRKTNIREELSQLEATATLIEDHFGGKEGILFTGAIPEDSRNWKVSMRNHILSVKQMREELIDALLPESVGEEERRAFFWSDRQSIEDRLPEFFRENVKDPEEEVVEL